MGGHRAWWDDVDVGATAFFLDVDGTLLGFKDQPQDVVADPTLLDILRRLRQAAGGAVALVSGRMTADLDRIVEPLVLPAGGVHGAELRFADGRKIVRKSHELAAVRPAAEALAACAGLIFEAKGATAFAIHYRRAPEREQEVLRALEGLVVGHDLMVQRGKMVAEVKARDLHKGAAIEALMGSAPFVGRSPLFIGDDLTDEHGFAAVLALGGRAVKVGAGETIASDRLTDPFDVRAFLEHVCRKISLL